jgi:hypothetical protein
MIKPKVVSADDPVNQIGTIFDAPLVTKGWTWLPLTEIIVMGIMTREAGRLHPNRNWLTRLRTAILTTTVILGSEWCHNLAHAVGAKMVRHPVDAIRVTWGMPLLVYHDLEDPKVSPHQHIVRAIGGPIINSFFFLMAFLLRPLTKPGSILRDGVNAALWMNTFLVTIGMLPIPGIDGGAVLKWALVEKGQTTMQADQTVRKANVASAAGLGTGAALAIKNHKHFLGVVLTVFASISLAVGAGFFREKE